MKKLSNKKGISLIVLVITIIVMIILAAAIILSLQSSGIIGRANEAKTNANDAQLSEAASIYLAEYDLAVKTGDANIVTDAESYVKEKLAEADFSQTDIDRITVVDGEVVLAGGIAISLADRISALNVPIGATVEGYTLTAKTHLTSGQENNGTVQELTTVTTLTWKYAGTDANGNVIILAEIPEEIPEDLTMVLYGMNGVINGPTELNNACAKLYTTVKGEGRIMTVEDIVEIKKTLPSLLDADSISDDFSPQGYWLYNTMTYQEEEGGETFYAMYCWDIYNKDTINWTLGGDGEDSGQEESVAPFRPVVEVKESVQVSYADGILTLN